MAQKLLPTGVPGVWMIEGTRKYKVTLDLGRQMKENKKTGKMEWKQVKTTKVVNSMREAKALLGENARAKRTKSITGVTGKISLSMAADEYLAYYMSEWSDSYLQQKSAQTKRLKAYFGDKDVRLIDTRDVEDFFRWCMEPHAGFPHALTANSVQKIKTHMVLMWRFMRKDSKYGITENVVEDADYGEIQKYEAQILTPAQINIMLEYAVKYEVDFSFLALVGLAGLTGLRRGEVCGLRWRNIDQTARLIDVELQRCQINTGSIEKVPKGGKDDGQTRAERKQRYAALSIPLEKLLTLVKTQQEAYLGRVVTGKDFVYMTKTNLVNGYLPHPGKVSRWFVQFQGRMNKQLTREGKEPLPQIRVHDLRHSFISMCLNSGVNVFQVAANCGHSFNEKGEVMTAAVYWHDDGNRDAIRECVERLIIAELAVAEDDIRLKKRNPVVNNRKNLRNNEL